MIIVRWLFGITFLTWVSAVTLGILYFGVKVLGTIIKKVLG